MAYATGRRYCDADSHILETWDWVNAHADPDIRDRLRPLGLKSAGAGASNAIDKAMARVQQGDAAPAIRDNVVAGPKGWAAYGAFDTAERTRALDDLGFERQLVFSTFSANQYLDHEDLAVQYGGLRAHNRAMAAFCKGDPRLIAVAQVTLEDTERALKEIDYALELGCGAFWLPAKPAGERSPGHPDLDPVWAKLEASGKPFMLHIGPASKPLPPEYKNNGHPPVTDWLGGGENLRFRDYMVLSFAPQMFLTALVYDGVFERFPGLRGGVIELGAGWVPEFLRSLDAAQRMFRKTDPAATSMSVKASDYIRRAVKFTPFPGEDVGRMMQDAGPELFVFSSDYPHPEGGKDPIGKFEATMGEIDERARDLFYAENFDAMMGGVPAQPLRAPVAA
jgi:predicted TIM-barrel fold metal-dependent hydrolase